MRNRFKFFIDDIYERKVLKLIILLYCMSFKLNRNFAILYGAMLGDGCLSLVYGRKKFVAITGSMIDDVPFFEGVIKPIVKQMIRKDIPIKFRRYKKAIDLNFVHHALFDYIHSFGFPYGKKGNKLFIPKVFYERRLIRYLIKGFFATDGSLVLTDNNGTLYPRVEANSISKNLLKEISDFINSKGINCKFYKSKRKFGYPPNHQQPYRIQINGKKNLKKFIKVVGFVNPKQIEKLTKFMAMEGVEPSVSAL